jgi:probable non-F420 flavinoid oxidoreductase
MIGYHASHEQFGPRSLLEYVQAAERAGFSAVSSSDHFHPWSRRQGQSGFAWSWLGAAMQASSLPFGIITAPGQRYHPAIIAQAVATLEDLYPGRFTVAVGSGELLNEGITGERWPPKEERNVRLEESVRVMRTLWDGRTVTVDNRVEVEAACLYTRPMRPPPLFGAALSARTAAWVGRWADGLITTARPPKALKEVVEAFQRGGGAGKPMHLKVDLSYAEDDEAALAGAYDQWRFVVLGSSVISELRTPDQFDAATTSVPPEALRNHVRISADPERQLAWLGDDIRLGFERIYLHNVNRNQERFIGDFGEYVLPFVSG